eukprot:CAMPEP_0179416384 /NCGR_PEP_ID=MMETSP0799-20121207/6766_1 /TAXON_ID=46947 /ORGANISM="Geminigera cryophila, Strain CCMP2564" /LENGTH=149 /DNA_ID=CAMNT_0021189245 /DNA_START=338 /DNA_END=787 /DNA_ORIENTATION=-
MTSSINSCGALLPTILSICVWAMWYQETMMYKAINPPPIGSMYHILVNLLAAAAVAMAPPLERISLKWSSDSANAEALLSLRDEQKRNRPNFDNVATPNMMYVDLSIVTVWCVPTKSCTDACNTDNALKAIIPAETMTPTVSRRDLPTG